MTDSAEEPRSLPDRPNLRHLKDQAKNLLKTGGVKSLAEAQFQIARLYGFASWPKLKAHVDLLEETGQLKQAIEHPRRISASLACALFCLLQRLLF